VAAAWNFLLSAESDDATLGDVRKKKSKTKDETSKSSSKGVDAEELLHLNDGAKLIICMVGKSAKGKSAIAGKIGRYLAWVGYEIRHFQLSSGSNSSDNNKIKEAVDWLVGGGQVAVYDSKFENWTKEQRLKTLQDLKTAFQVDVNNVSLSYRVLWLETYSEKDSANVNENNDSTYESLDPADDELLLKKGKGMEGGNSFIKLIDYGKTMVTHNVQGYLESKLASFCVNLHTEERVILMVRHGESLYNVEDRLGGDPVLSERGEVFAKELARFIRDNFGDTDTSTSNGNDANNNNNSSEKTKTKKKEKKAKEKLGSYKDLSVWTSQLQRTIQTAAPIDCRAKVPWVSLSEIDAGICEGMTYKEFKERLFAQYSARQRDKLNWRYPQGESYVDVKKRLEPVIFEAERQRKPLLVVAHRAVLRCLYSYFANIESSETPFLPFPLHTVVILRSTPSGWDEDRVALDPVPGDTGAHEKVNS